MGVKLRGKSTVIKALNNNMVLVKDQGVEKILLSKGIGFNKRFGDILEENLEVDKIFSIEDERNQQNLKEVYNRVDGEFIAICESGLKSVAGHSFIKLYNVVSMATSFCISFFAIQLQATWI